MPKVPDKVTESALPLAALTLEKVALFVVLIVISSGTSVSSKVSPRVIQVSSFPEPSAIGILDAVAVAVAFAGSWTTLDEAFN